MMDADDKHAIFEAILSDRKVEAIKLLREASGLALAEAKDVIEQVDAALMRDGVDSPAASQLLDEADSPRGGAQPAGGVDEEQLLALLRAGKKIEAIKVYREAHGVGLRDAKLAVDAIARSAGIIAKAGCAGMVLLLLCPVALGMAAAMRELVERML